MNNLKSIWVQITNFFSECMKTYSFWLEQKKIQRHSRLTKRQFNFQCKIKNLDNKLVKFIQKIQMKKQRCQEKLDRVNRKLDRLDKVQQVEVVTKKTRSENKRISLPSF
ncbi:hypothetical protein [Mycoplasma ovis]|nr:hypothetical protein [Mycoplasma ovis]